jgi:sec-independent protein translocase protein TatA
MTPPGGWEWIVILFIVLLLFGARKLPDLAGSVGRSIKEFRKASQEALDEDEPDERGTES